MKLLELDTTNSNGRIYPRELFNDFVFKNEYLGEFNNSTNYNISLKDVSHSIKNIELKDNVIYGDIKILDTPNGKVVKELLKDMPLSVVPRGTSKIDQNGFIRDYELITFDLISEKDSSFNEENIKQYYIEKIDELLC